MFTLGNARLFKADRGDNDVVLLVEATVTLSELGTRFCEDIAGWFDDVCAGTAPDVVALAGNFSFEVSSSSLVFTGGFESSFSHFDEFSSFPEVGSGVWSVFVALFGSASSSLITRLDSKGSRLSDAESVSSDASESQAARNGFGV